MVSEESALDHAIEAAGLTVVETDLGEYILQINDYEPPSHIIGPALHKSKEEVAELFHKKHGTPLKDGIEELCLEARGVLREPLPHRRHGHLRRQFLRRRDGLGRARHQRGQRDADDDAAQGARRDFGHREDRADAGGRRDADAAAAALGDRPVDLELRRRPDRHQGRRRVPRRRAHVFHHRRQRPHRGAGQRRARGAALHSLRRVHEPLPRLPEHRRPRVRLGLSGADRLDPDARCTSGSRTRSTCRRRRRCATSAASCARSRFRCPTCSASCAKRSSSGTCGRGTSAPGSSCGRGSRCARRCTAWRPARACACCACWRAPTA